MFTDTRTFVYLLQFELRPEYKAVYYHVFLILEFVSFAGLVFSLWTAQLHSVFQS